MSSTLQKNSAFAENPIVLQSGIADQHADDGYSSCGNFGCSLVNSRFL